jgi:hypothetical protein
LIAVLPEESESSIIIHHRPGDAIPHLVAAMRQFTITYQYEQSTTPLGLQYNARMTFWGIGGAPHYFDRPYAIEVFRHPDGGTIVRYQGHGDIRNSANPVVNDLKASIIRGFGREHISYEYTPAHWRITGPGD